MTEPEAPDPKFLRRRTHRNWAVFLVLGCFAALIYAVTIVKIKMGYGP